MARFTDDDDRDPRPARPKDGLTGWLLGGLLLVLLLAGLAVGGVFLLNRERAALRDAEMRAREAEMMAREAAAAAAAQVEKAQADARRRADGP